MRINPIGMAYNRQNLRPQNQNKNQNNQALNQNKNIAFGKFENEEVRNHFRENILGAYNDDCILELSRDAFEYLDATPFVTIKKRKGITYAVLEKEAVDRHKNKEKLYWCANNYFELIDPKVCEKRSKEAGILDSEPDFLEELDGAGFDFDNGMAFKETDYEAANKAMRSLHQSFENAENYSKEEEEERIKRQKTSDDSWDEELSNWDKIHQWNLF